MSTTAEKKQKKEKKEKKEKKDSKKRKINDISDPITQPDASEAKAVPTASAESPNAGDQSVDNVDQKAEQSPSKKRKPNVEEIEVDISAPEPPSRRNLRLLKKGKPLPPSKNDSDAEEERKKEKKSAASKRSEYGIWIGNLAFSVSKADLRGFLVCNSDITEEMITRVHMPGPNDKKPANKVEEDKFEKKIHNKGFAYVDFSSAEAVEKAVALSEQLLSGRRVLIKNSKSFEGRPEKTEEADTSKNDGKPPSKRIFVGNLSFDTTEESLKQHFEKCGPIDSIKIATFEDSGKCKGYGWVVFEELEAAQNAVKGFVYIEEEASDAEDEDDAGPDGEAEKPAPKQTKRRKWWINRFMGRPLRMEFAEDAQVRYKKRFGKDGTKAATSQAASSSGPEEPTENPVAVIKPKKVEYRTAYAPRLTGGIVESTGKKITF